MAHPDEKKQQIQDENRRLERTPKERPERGPDPGTLEGPGDRHDAKAESDARNKVTRRGER